MTALAANVGGFITLLGAAVLIGILAERVRVPAAVALVGIGTFIEVPPPFAFGDALFVVFLPPLIFEAAWNLDLPSLRRMAWQILMLAIPGTVATAFFIGGALALTHVLPFAAALLLGAIVAATDPVAVVAAFRHVPVPAAIRTLVEAESLSNDGVALVLFGFALALAAGNQVSLGGDILRGVYEIVGGTAIGAAAGMVCAAVVRIARSAEYEVTITIVLAYVAYLLAAALQCSGIFATAAGAIALRIVLDKMPGALGNAEDVDRVWAAAAFVANAVVFLATGLLIRPSRIVHQPLLVLVAVAAVLLARLLLALLATRDRAGRITIFLAGMRGALPLALALSLPDTLRYRPQIIDATFAVVLVTIVAQGAPLEVVLSRLYRGAAAD
ncbi:MAG TPA: cation:proton antiporter [Candidatus Limnocylindria bacterium]|jgi:CPA1 family monovalent cation:H+ antiporter|nr:cation:proton antiporter [Candidatus Limnocylindria bacterium]